MNPEVDTLGTFGLIVSAGFSDEMLFTEYSETARDIRTIAAATYTKFMLHAGFQLGNLYVALIDG